MRRTVNPRRRAVLTIVLPALLIGVLLTNPAAAARKPKPEPAAAAAPGVPPKDARWTLYCQAIAGPAHVAQANSAKDELIKMTKLPGWYVIHQEGQSVLYYGFYKSIDDNEDKSEAARALSDRTIISKLTDPSGAKVFERCFFVQVSAPDPLAPPEWNLLNAEGYWTLQIAAYKDSPRRKEAAVEAVRAARAQNIPAYYYHGETTSSVCIGVWPRSAVREQESADEVFNDPTRDLLVLDRPLAGAEDFQIRNREGERVKAVAPRFEPTDPSLLAALEQYPTHAVNGEVTTRQIEDPVTKQPRIIEDPSFLVVIPQPKSSILRAERPPEAPQLLNPAGAPRPSAAGKGKLKSID